MSPIRPENRDRYPADWPAISRAIKVDRAGGRCECAGECGRGTHEGRCPNRHGEPAYGTGSKVVLTTAHLDHTPENCEPENLKAMCQGCHLHYDRDHHAASRAATMRAAAASEPGLFPANQIIVNQIHVHPSDPLRDVNPCQIGKHRPAYLAAGGIACGVCGVRLR